MAALPPTPKLATVTTPGGAKFSVAADYAPRFQAFLNELAQTYKIDPATSGGYNPRMIAGTNTPSEHAYGRAIDVDWNQNPQGAGKKFTIDPATARALAQKYGMTWGGDWSGSSADPMHFQVNQQVAWTPEGGAVAQPGSGVQVASSQPANGATAVPVVTNNGAPVNNPNSNAPATTPTSSDIANAFQTHLAALQQQNQNLQLQSDMVNQRNKALALGIGGDPYATFASSVASAFSGTS